MLHWLQIIWIIINMERCSLWSQVQVHVEDKKLQGTQSPDLFLKGIILGDLIVDADNLFRIHSHIQSFKVFFYIFDTAQTHYTVIKQWYITPEVVASFVNNFGNIPAKILPTECDDLVNALDTRLILIDSVAPVTQRKVTSKQRAPWKSNDL